MKLHVHKINLPVANAPLLSQQVEMVSLYDVRIELEKLRLMASDLSQDAETKTKRFKHPRFRAAKNYWSAAAVSYDVMRFHLSEFLKQNEPVP